MGVEVKLAELIRHEFLSIAFDMGAVEARLGVPKALATHSTNRSLEEFRPQIRREKRREIKLHHSPQQRVPIILLVKHFVVHEDSIAYFAEANKHIARRGV